MLVVARRHVKTPGVYSNSIDLSIRIVVGPVGVRDSRESQVKPLWRRPAAVLYKQFRMHQSLDARQPEDDELHTAPDERRLRRAPAVRARFRNRPDGRPQPSDV